MQIQVEIDVDLSFPEHNREVFVFVFSGKKHQGKLHDGISIELVADVRDVTKGLYKAFILPNRPDVFIQFPAQSASFALDHRLVSEKEGTNLCDKVKEARDITRNAIQSSEKRKLKNFLLKFPGYMSLSNTIYSPKSKDGKIKLISAPYKLPIMIGQIPYSSLPCRISWKIHIVEAMERIVDEEDDEDNTYEYDLIRAMEGMQR